MRFNQYNIPQKLSKNTTDRSEQKYNLLSKHSFSRGYSCSFQHTKLVAALRNHKNLV